MGLLNFLINKLSQSSEQSEEVIPAPIEDEIFMKIVAGQWYCNNGTCNKWKYANEELETTEETEIRCFRDMMDQERYYFYEYGMGFDELLDKLDIVKEEQSRQMYITTRNLYKFKLVQPNNSPAFYECGQGLKLYPI